MGFLTEMFSRPRPHELGRTQSIDAVVQSVRGNGRFDVDCRPADFPKLPRELARR